MTSSCKFLILYLGWGRESLLFILNNKLITYFCGLCSIVVLPFDAFDSSCCVILIVTVSGPSI